MRQLCCKFFFNNSILKIVFFRKNEGSRITFEDIYIFRWSMLTTLKMARKQLKLQEESPAGCDGEGKQNKQSKGN